MSLPVLSPENHMITDRRSILAGLALVAAAPAIARAQTMGADPTPIMDLNDVKSASQYYMGVIGRAELSLVTSQMAVAKVVNKNAHEFAGFELGEAITVNMVLKDLGAKSVSKPDDMTMIEKVTTAKEGKAFDTAYITFQLENHQDLRDLADAYLHNSAGASDPDEKQGRHLASLMLAVFKEHTAICKRITEELGA